MHSLLVFQDQGRAVVVGSPADLGDPRAVGRPIGGSRRPEDISARGLAVEVAHSQTNLQTQALVGAEVDAGTIVPGLPAVVVEEQLQTQSQLHAPALLGLSRRALDGVAVGLGQAAILIAILAGDHQGRAVLDTGEGVVDVMVVGHIVGILFDLPTQQASEVDAQLDGIAVVDGVACAVGKAVVGDVKGHVQVGGIGGAEDRHTPICGDSALLTHPGDHILGGHDGVGKAPAVPIPQIAVVDIHMLGEIGHPLDGHIPQGGKALPRIGAGCPGHVARQLGNRRHCTHGQEQGAEQDPYSQFFHRYISFP